MQFADLFRLASGNLLRNRTRSALTLIGVAVGVAALYALLSYGTGLQRLADEEFATLELYNTLRVTSTPNPIDSFMDVSVRTLDPARTDTMDLVPLTDSVLAEIAALPDVLAAYPEVAFPVRVRVGKQEVFAGAEAVPMQFQSLPAYQPTAGAFFATPADSAVLIPPSMAERLGFVPAETAVGQDGKGDHGDARLREAPAGDVLVRPRDADAPAEGAGARPPRGRRAPRRGAGALRLRPPPRPARLRRVAPKGDVLLDARPRHARRRHGRLHGGARPAPQRGRLRRGQIIHRAAGPLRDGLPRPVRPARPALRDPQRHARDRRPDRALRRHDRDREHDDDERRSSGRARSA